MMEWIVKRKVAVSMLFLGLTILGYISYRNLDVELLPNVELPFLIVRIDSATEVDPGYIEREAIMPIEGAAGLLNGIQEIRSFANERSGQVVVFFTPDINLKYAYLKLEEKIDALAPTLPATFFVNVIKIDTEQFTNTIMTLQLRGSGGVDRLRNIAESKIRPEFEALDGIATVQVSGGQEKSVEILLDEDAARAYDLTPSQVQTLIRRNNNYKAYLGQMQEDDRRYFANLVADYRTIPDLENIVIRPEGPVLLKDIATIHVGVKEETSISRVGGKDAVTIRLIRDAQVNILRLAEKIYPLIDDLNEEYGSMDVELVRETDSAENLKKNVDLVNDLALTGGLLAILVLWFFLRQLRLILIIAVTLPVSILVSFNLFYAFDISLNTLTLVGMALAVGMLLDNSIVVLENIYRLAAEGRPLDRVSVEGTSEIWRSIVAATLTTVTVFLPFIFAENFLVRLIGYQIGISIISTLLVSLAVALLLIPMLTHSLLRQQDRETFRFFSASSNNRMMHNYTLLLKSAIRYPVRTIITTLVIFIFTLLLALTFSLDVPEESQLDNLNVYLTMPGGSTLATTDLAAADLESRFDGVEEVQDVITEIQEEKATLTLRLKDNFPEIANRDLKAIKWDITERMDSFRAGEAGFDPPPSAQSFASRGGDLGIEAALGIGEARERIVIKGGDLSTLRRLADDIAHQIRQLESIDNARVEVGANRPELHLFYEDNILNQMGINRTTIGNELSGFQGELDAGVNYKTGDDEFSIVIRQADIGEKKLEDLRRVDIPTANSGTVPLAQISEFLKTEGRSEISRLNQERLIEIRYQFRPEVLTSNIVLEAARQEIDEITASLEIPTGIAIEVFHSEVDLSDFYFLITMAFILIYMILSSVFESLLNPLIILFTIPLAGIGSLLAILVTEISLMNATTFIGFLILLGIVVNNGIILIDFTRLLRERGYRYQRALMTAGRARLRPILITAITTIIAMLPLAMGKVDFATQIASPFAITVIGGLALSTAFTLLLIPTVYAGMESALRWLGDLRPGIKLLQFAALLGGGLLIYFQVESLLWQIANFFLLLGIIPGLTWFITESLRTANTRLIPAEEAIQIEISHLYKIYDFPGRFRRAWDRGKALSATLENLIGKGWFAFLEGSWHLMLFGFLVYFTYQYLPGKFWIWVLIHIVYFYGNYLLNRLLSHRSEKSDKSLKGRVQRYIPALWYWLFPISNLLWLQERWQNTAMPIIYMALAYIALHMYRTADKISEGAIDIHSNEGRFAGIRRRYYRLVMIMPIIGRRRKPFAALSGVSLDIGNGMFGLLGPNGAGKTTLMRIICGILEPSYGSISINGFNARDYREELQGLIGYLPQDFGAYNNMSAYDYLSYQAILKDILDPDERHRRVEEVLKTVHLEEKQNERIGSYSGGMRQRVGIAQTLLHLPRILVVDEPTAGLDPRERIRFRNLLVELSRERAVIFSTHVIEDIASSCDRVAVMNKGELLYLGVPTEMAQLANGKVWQFYIDPDEFNAVNEAQYIVHHIKIDEKIRVRSLAENAPTADAVEVTPTLEDAYLWSIRQRTGRNGQS